MIVRVTVPGVPQPQGSTRGFIGRGKAAGRVIITSDNAKLRPWRLDMCQFFVEAWRGRPTTEGPVTLAMHFRFPRPKGHFGKRGLRPSAPAVMVVKPDLDKLIRAVKDALRDAAAYRDDAQVVSIEARKRYAYPDETPGLSLSFYADGPQEKREIA